MFSYVLWTVSYSFPVFVAARLLAGMSKGTVSLSTAIASDVTSVEQRPKAMVSIVHHLCDSDLYSISPRLLLVWHSHWALYLDQVLGHGSHQ